MGVRKIKPNFRSITGTHGASGQDFESKLESELMILQQFDNDVDHFESQPLKISYVDQLGTARTYTPDLLIYYKQSTGRIPLLCEVKYRSEYREKFAELRQKFKAARRFAKANQMQFRVITDREIRTPFLDNAKLLLKYRQIEIDPTHARMLLDALKNIPECSPRLLLSTISNDKMVQASILPVLWHLIDNFTIQADLTKVLTMTSRIQLASLAGAS